MEQSTISQINGIKAPTTLKHRFIFERVPMNLILSASLGKYYAVSMQAMESIIRRSDYWRRGCRVERLQLEQWSISEITRFFQEGIFE